MSANSGRQIYGVAANRALFSASSGRALWAGRKRAYVVTWSGYMTSSLLNVNGEGYDAHHFFDDASYSPTIVYLTGTPFLSTPRYIGTLVRSDSPEVTRYGWETVVLTPSAGDWSLDFFVTWYSTNFTPVYPTNYGFATYSATGPTVGDYTYTSGDSRFVRSTLTSPHVAA